MFAFRPKLLATRPSRTILPICAFVLLVVGIISAIEPPKSSLASITVSDEKGKRLADVTIEVRLANQPISTITTDASGQARVTFPAVGDYTVTISKGGYVETQTTVQVGGDTPVSEIEIVLPKSALSQQEIEVSAKDVNPTTESASAPNTISSNQAKIIPDKPATVIEALPLVPGVVRAPDGSVQIAGYGETHSALLVNSVNVTDPGTGDFGLSIPIDSVETISVSEMPYLAQYGKFTAGVVAAETRRGGEKWEYSLNDPLPDFRIRSGHLQGVKDASPRLNFSGPVIPNRLYFLEGAEYLLYKRTVYTLPFPQNQTRSEAVNSFSQLDLVVSPKHAVSASYHFAPQALEYAGLNFFNPQPVTPNARFRESTFTLIDRAEIAGGVLQSTFANTQVRSGIHPQGLQDMVLTPEGDSGNYFREEHRSADRFQWLENWKPRALHWKGEHNLQVGMMIAHSESEGEFQARSVQIQDGQGHLIRQIEFTHNGTYDVTDTEPAYYVQDHWLMTPHFAVDAGFRLEAPTITSTIRTAPRLGFVWNPERLPNTVIRGGTGIFYDSVPLDVYAFRRYPDQVVTTYDVAGNVTDGPRTYYNVMEQSYHHFGLVHHAPTTGNFAPFNISGNVEVEHTFARGIVTKVRYLQSVAEDVITLRQRDIGTAGVVALGSSGSARTRQLEFTTKIGRKEARQFFFSYVRQHARGDINDANSYLGNFPFPVVHSTVNASLPSEIPNRFLLWGSYSLPRKMMVTPKVEMRNGFSYQYSDLYQNLLPTAGPQSRFPKYFSLDFRLSKDIVVRKNHAIRLSGSVVNLTNHFNALEVHHNLADPSFGSFFGTYARRVTVDFDFLY